jgi:PAS domain S-box-containing protein
MKQRLSLSGKLILNFLLIAIAAIAIVGTFSYFSAEEAIRQRTLDQLTSVCAAKKNNLLNFFHSRSNELKIICSSHELKFPQPQMNDHVVLPGDSLHLQLWSSEQDEPAYIQYIRNCGYYSQLCVFDQHFNGYILSLKKSTEPATAKYFRAQGSEAIQTDSLSEDIFIRDYNCGKSGTAPSLMICGRIQSEGSSFPYWLCLQINPAAIDSIMLESSPMDGLGHTGETYIVGPDSLLRSGSRFPQWKRMQTLVANAAVRDALAGKSGSMELTDYRNKQVHNAHSPLNISGLHWAIMAEIDKTEVMGPLQHLRYRMLLLSALVVLLLSAYFYLVSKRITLPVIRLKKAAEKIGRGEFDINVDVRTHDEIGALTLSFNRMALHLQDMTKTLKEREERLTHFYDATIDGIVLHDEDRPVLVNQAFIRMTGYTESELLNMELGKIFHMEKCDSPFRVPLRPFTYESTATRRDRSIFPIEVQQNAIEYYGKMIFASVIRDITGRKDFEKELQAERLKRLSWVIDGQEIERERLSRELHDGLGQMLVGIKLRLEGTFQVEDPKTRAVLDDLSQLFNKTIEEIRRISNDIMPSGLQEFGIVNGLRKLCTSVSESSGMEVEFVTSPLPDQIPSKTILYLYRIAQEAMNNSVKHSGASKIRVELSCEKEVIHLWIQDNGRGFKQDKTYTFVGNGLYNMRERVTMMQGSIEVESAPDWGTSISVKIPVHRNSHSENIQE